MQLEVDWKISGAMAFKGCFYIIFFVQSKYFSYLCIFSADYVSTAIG